MKSIAYFFASLSVAVFLLIEFSCGKNPSNASRTRQKSSTVVLKASAKQALTTTNMNETAVPGGTIKVTSTLLNISEIDIEGTGRIDNENENEEHDGDLEKEQDEPAEDNEDDEGEIEVQGPFTIDIGSGEAFIDSVAVLPGTFRKVELEFAGNNAVPFEGKSILIKGEFIPTNGMAVPFTLKSEFAEEIESLLAGDGITVCENAAVPVVVTFDLAEFLKISTSAAPRWSTVKSLAMNPTTQPCSLHLKPTLPKTWKWKKNTTMRNMTIGQDMD